MKKVLAVMGIILPFVSGFLWMLTSFISQDVFSNATQITVPLVYINTYALIFTLIGIVTLCIGIVYLGREKWISHKEIIPQSRKLTRKNVRKFSLGILLLFVLQMIQNGLSEPNQPMTTGIFILTLLIGIAYLRVDFWLKKISLSLSSEQKIRATDIITDPMLFLKYLVAYIIIWISAVIGILLFIVPWVYVSLRLGMVPYLILEKKVGPWAAIKESRTLTRGKTSNLFGLNILLGWINILWLLALVVGLFWTLPLFYIANAIFYKKLLALKK